MNRVLIVDDQPEFRRQLCKLLLTAGFNVVEEADSIASALEIVRTAKPDIAVVDVMLPGENGLEGTRKLRTANENVRVFLVSAHHDSADLFVRSAKEIGAEAFIPKDELDLATVIKWKNRFSGKQKWRK
jgi:DNA-binding NarL/FixJ family response regulator